MLAQGPQAVERAEPPKHRPQRHRHAGAVRVIVELLYHDEFQEDQGQGLAVVHLQQKRGLVCAGGRRSLQLYNWISYEEELHPPLRLLLFWLPAATTWPCKHCTLPLSHRQQGCYLYRVQGRGWDTDFSRQSSRRCKQ